ncbi:hypothetical protein A6R68_19039 [Neotoma lepida]|uniref:Uncharacterized protein n=1 Tax=Neotoma lepida TaxID=56216 RepID=A0A1A6HKS7_NEOLE|nr:hypothetical protein A6R68_19039 [Neotoma lepida]
MWLRDCMPSFVSTGLQNQDQTRSGDSATVSGLIAQKVSSFHQFQNNVLGLTQQTDSQLLQNVGVIKLAERKVRRQHVIIPHIFPNLRQPHLFMQCQPRS